jgi:hypothetical protein
MCPNQKEAGLYIYGTIFISLVAFYQVCINVQVMWLLTEYLQTDMVGNITIETYDLPTSPVEKPPCVPHENSIDCLQDGIVTRVNVSDNDMTFAPLTYSYTFCK